MEEGAAQSTIAKEHIKRLRKGEDVFRGLGKPLVQRDFIAMLILIASNVRYRLLELLFGFGAYGGKDQHGRADARSCRR
jgi:hypothetical protein